MSQDQHQILVLDPQRIDLQFKKEFDLKTKLSELQMPVFRNFTIKKSKSVYHRNNISPEQMGNRQQVCTQKAQDNCLFFTESNFRNGANITNLRFGVPLQNTSSSSPKLVLSARTLPSFSPLRTKLCLRKPSEHTQRRLQQGQVRSINGFKRNISQKIKQMQKRNSQTILRKNSLFMINCLKTRYKESKKAHIGEVDGVANMRLGRFSEKNGAVTQYQQRFEYMQQARQRLLNARVIEGESKLSRVSPLMPQPW